MIFIIFRCFRKDKLEESGKQMLDALRGEGSISRIEFGLG